MRSLIPAVLVFCLPLVAEGQQSIEQTVLSLERSIDAAFQSADTMFLETALADDLVYTHGDQWTSGGEPYFVDGKEKTIDRMTGGSTRLVDSQQVEVHGSVAITTGRIQVSGKREYSLRYLRVYRKAETGWQLVSHRTVRLNWEE